MPPPDSSPPPPRFTRHDLFELMAIAVLGPIAWLLPERVWMPVGHVLSLAIARLWPGVTRARTATLARALGGRDLDVSLAALRVAIMDGYMEERLEILRAHRPGGWQPRIRLVGREHLDAALACGRGAVLWTAPFSYADLVTKMALAAAGVPVSHLSAFSRGFSPNSCIVEAPSRFGTRVLSPLRTRIEDRHLRERIALARDGSLGWARAVERRLAANGVVSIRAGASGHRAVDVPMLAGRLRLATGAPSLATAAGAPLLPLFIVRTGPGSFDVVIEAPLESTRTGNRHDVTADLARAYGRVLERYVLRHPELWSGWYALEVDAAPAALDASAPIPLAGARRRA